MTDPNWWLIGLAVLATFVLGAVFSRWQEKRRRTPEQVAERAPKLAPPRGLHTSRSSRGQP